MPFRSVRILLFFAALALGVTEASAQTRLLRFPDIHKDKVVFTYAGDLWLAPAAGGTATRLTAHPGIELFAKFSPDGQWIAFTGQYEGDEQVYVIPSTGGVPKQLTWYPARGPLSPRWGYDNQVHGWTRDGKAVLFRSLRDGWDLSDSRLYTVPLTGSLGEPLPMPVSGAGDLSPDGKQVVYTPMARDFRTWKRYQGGWAQDLWIFDLATYEAKNITSHPRTDRDPMWVGDKIYFNSDRTGTLNLFSYDPQSGAVAQLTRSTRGDVRWPSAGDDGRIVYEMEGELAVFDTRSGQSRPVPITVPGEGLGNRPSQVSAARQIEDGALAPKGERVLLVARGDVFTVPIEKGLTRNLTRTSGAHDKWARWSPDGRKVAFISDRDGEDELYLISQDGSGKPEQLTDGGKAMRYAPEWAPDGKRIAFSDKDGKLYVYTLADRKLAEIADERHGQVRDYVWSPCGGWLAFSLRADNNFRSLYLWSAADGKLRRVNDESFDETQPAWDPQGNYLFFLSGRDYSPIADFFDFNYAITNNTGIYAMALRRDVPHPFPPESDEVTITEEDEEKKEAKKEAKKEEGKTRPLTRIDFAGLAGRVARVPVPFGNYSNLSAKDGHLLYLKNGNTLFSGDPDTPPVLQIFALKERKESTLAGNVDDYALSQDGGKVLVQQGAALQVLNAAPDGKDSGKPISTDGLVVDRVPAEEWAEIFDESWRRYRDFFYVPTMHGYDWEAIREQYRPLLAHVGHRSDLNYVIGEMIAELNVSHAYVAGGDFQLPDRPRVALPGARFALDHKAGRYKIVKIFRGQNEEDLYRAPLTEIGVDAREGDYLLAIDGEDLPANDNPYRLLRHKADRPVRFTVNDRPTYEGAREVVFTPLSTETNLIYLDWITANRERVDKLSGGRVGYLHIPDMGSDGLREFIKAFYPQLRKEGLIVDVRSNGGGFVSATILDRLRRQLLAVDFSRNDESPTPYPQSAFHGHMASLINETSSSDGDIFAAMFREMGLGPLIGKRTWGGVVGISGSGPLLDGGQISVPESGSVSVDGRWIIEGEGVSPDIDVENDPKSLLAGRDPQLERGVEEVMKKIREQPKKLPTRPAPPVKTQAGQ
ncbi:MAG TPA: S41 family peptidase [Thermoanaerobaculia bacterium]|nr:S41 family peptidase [Thermoanaerobaculia bacterium]